MMQVTTLWDKTSELTWKEKVAYLSYQLLQCKNKPELPVTHIFAPGIYIREMTIPAKTMFIGREHLFGHLCQLVSGSLIMFTPEGRFNFIGPHQIYTKPGDHMVIYTLTECLGRTVHANITDSRDTEVLESLYFGSREEVLELGKSLYERAQALDHRRTA